MKANYRIVFQDGPMGSMEKLQMFVLKFLRMLVNRCLSCNVTIDGKDDFLNDKRNRTNQERFVPNVSCKGVFLYEF